MTPEESIKRYPFLQVRDMDDTPIEGISYLEDVPDGWKSIFLLACESIRKRLAEHGNADTYRITQVKEKFGSLRVYDNMVDSTPAHDGVSDIIMALESQSARICIDCGAPATWESDGWISPYCDKCKERLEDDGVRFSKYR